MSLLFVLLVIGGFALMVAAKAPGSRILELWAWIVWLVAAIIWGVSTYGGV